MFNQIKSPEREKEIEAHHEAMRVQIDEVIACPQCGNKETRCAMANDEKTILMMECPSCKNSWMHKR